MQDLIEKYCEKQAYKLASRIDEHMAVVIKPKPTWCPRWLYLKIINDSVELIQIKK